MAFQDGRTNRPGALGWLLVPCILISVRMIPSNSMDSYEFMIMRHYEIQITMSI